MAPNAAEYEESERLQAACGRVGPQLAAPARAWAETECLLLSPGSDAHRLLPAVHQPSKRLQAGLTLGVWNAQSKKYPDIKPNKLVKTKLQKRKEKIYAALRLPFFILTINVILIVVHALKTEALQNQLDWSPRVWCREPWRLVTYSMVHGNNTHLALNAIVALAVGWCLEHEQKWWRVMALWSGGVVAGALGAGAFQPAVHVVGASAAVYALLTGHIANVCLRYGHIPLWWFRPLSVLVIMVSEGCWTVLHKPSTLSMVTSSPASLSSAIHMNAAAVQMEEHVAWSSHLFGAFVGIPLAFLVFTGENTSMVKIKICRIMSGVVLLVVIVLMMLKNTIWMRS